MSSATLESSYARLKAQLETMPTVEQAKGILMARERCGPEEAFDLLRRMSQRANVKVHVLAALLVERAPGHPVGNGSGSEPRGAAPTPLDPDQPQAAWLPRGSFQDPRQMPATAALLDEVLDFGLGLLHADRGNIQLADPATGMLRIAAHRGFGAEFLEYFAVVADDSSACGRAARGGAQVMIADVSTDPGFAPHRDIASASGFRAVQSTPLIDASGRLVGMLSTHYPRPGSLPARDLQVMARFGTLIGEWLAPLLNRAEPASRPPDQRPGQPGAEQHGSMRHPRRTRKLA